MNPLYEARLTAAKSALVPALFTETQFSVLLKRAQGKPLSQTERNYLSTAIKSKLKATLSINHLNLDRLYTREKSKRALLNQIITSYAKSGITLVGAKPSGKTLPANQVVEEVLDNFTEIDARIADLLPVYISKNRNNLRFFDLFSFVIEKGLVNIAGYVFSIVQELAPHPRFSDFLKALERHKENVPFLRDRRYEKITNLITQDDISKRWNIYTLNTLEHYKDYFELYRGLLNIFVNL